VTDYVETLALRLAQAHGHRAEAYELAVKAEDFAEWHDVPLDERLRFARLFCADPSPRQSRASPQLAARARVAACCHHK
jgi:hypothetical protein